MPESPPFELPEWRARGVRRARRRARDLGDSSASDVGSSSAMLLCGSVPLIDVSVSSPMPMLASPCCFFFFVFLRMAAAAAAASRDAAAFSCTCLRNSVTTGAAITLSLRPRP